MEATRTRHSMVFKLKTGVQKDGEIIVRSMEVISNTGAYSAHGHSVCGNIGGQFSVLYPAPNLSYKATTVYINLLIASAMRGYGIPQLTFAVESHMDNIAQEMKWDPIEFREKNLCKIGDYNSVNGFAIRSCGLPEIIAKGKSIIKWDEKRALDKLVSGKYYGVGMALFSYFQSTFPHNVELAGARIMMNENGSATLFIGCAEIGQGTDTTMAQIAAEAIGIKAEQIKVIGSDTALSVLLIQALMHQDEPM
nr:molybdopterin cofactor-binding domain-containing protein [endosymbiont 'TC1' of Trimyema compressum]